MAYCDYLTGLPNKELFLLDFKNVISKNMKTFKNGALIFINLDNFKDVNYAMGYFNGDLLLKSFSQIINRTTTNYGTLFRFSGDEFMILVDDIKSISDVEELCSNILHHCKDPFEIDKRQVYITVSVGISIFPKDSCDMSELLKFCDLAMRQSKAKGKNIYTFFQRYLSHRSSREFLIKQELKNCIKEKELSLVYQPQIDAIENKIVGVEALLRWNNKRLGSVPPNEFITIAEETGMITIIGEWVLEEVCKNIHKWRYRNYDFNTISINISPLQIQESNFKDNIIDACYRNKIQPDDLEIEITEKILMKIDSKKISDLSDLINKSVSVAIDDFGAEYSSLNYLMVLPFNTLKIDRSFILNIDNEKNRAIIECIINLSKLFKCRLIVEGVETKKQLDILIQLGCKIIQGYYFSKPIPEEELENIFLYNQKKNKKKLQFLPGMNM
ncbi:MAG: putative bifunctional diguanylate cyclase/phosphodiesterase [Eubacteriales bacterium]